MSDIKLTAEEKAAARKEKKEAKAAAKAEKKAMPKAKKQRVSFSESYDKLQASIPALFLTSVATVIIMFMVCAAVFFGTMKGAEQVLVPNVVGKTLEDGIIEMQIKELYPKVSLRYSDEVKEKGIILEQNPEAGAIVKGYSTVTLVVSRGEVEEEVTDLVGKLFDTVNGESLLSEKKTLISFSEPSYIINPAPAGTIIAQSPTAGYKVSEPVKVNLVVSKGPAKETVAVPDVKGMGVEELISVMGNSNLIFDVTYHNAAEGEIAGTVVSQKIAGDQIKEKYTRVGVEMALDDNIENSTISGVFHENLSEYPVPVLMCLEAVTPEGKTFDIARIKHVGGEVTIPYSVPKGSTLIFTVLGDVKNRTVIG